MSELALAVPPVRPRFGTGMAIATLLLFLCAQMSVGTIIAVGGMILTFARHGVNDAAAMSAMMTDIGPALLIASAAISAAVAMFVARAWAWPLVTDRSAGGIGIIATPARHILPAMLAGVALGSLYIAVAQYLLPPRIGTPLGPLMKIAASGMSGWWSFAIIALFVAPPVEEFLFRGLLLKGFAESWGMTTAAIIVSVVFILLHVPETMHYWPALIAVSALAIGVLATRLVTGSVVAAMALHAAYNAVMVVIAFTAM
jgi:membrane protease YdiL (CAAX protease family)